MATDRPLFSTDLAELALFAFYDQVPAAEAYDRRAAAGAACLCFSPEFSTPGATFPPAECPEHLATRAQALALVRDLLGGEVVTESHHSPAGG